MAQPASGGDGLGRRVTTSARWASLATAVNLVATLATTIALARLLTRTEFGLAAMALLVVAVLALFQDSGLHAAVIQRRERVREAIDSAGLYAPLSGLVLGAICLLAAPLVALFFDTPEVEGLVRTLAIVFVIRSFSIVPNAILMKELLFARRAAVQICGALLQLGVAIGFAAGGAGAYAVVFGQIASSLVLAIGYTALTPVRPDPRRARLSELRELLDYGRHIVAGNTVGFLNSYLDAALIGRLFGPALLGAYTIGFQTGRQAVTTVTYVTNQVVFPTYSKLQDDLARLQRAYLRSLRFISMVSMPVAFGLAALSSEIIRVVYGDKWEDAIPVLAIIAMQGLFLSVSATTGELFKAKGRPDLFFQMGLAQLLLLLGLIIALYPFEIVGFAGARAVAAFVIGAVSLILAGRVINLHLLEWSDALTPSFVSAFVMTCGVVATKLALGTVVDTANAFILIALVVEALALYVGALRLLFPDRWNEFMGELDNLGAFSALRARAGRVLRARRPRPAATPGKEST